jgi:hypothetical protein
MDTRRVVNYSGLRCYYCTKYSKMKQFQSCIYGLVLSLTEESDTRLCSIGFRSSFSLVFDSIQSSPRTSCALWICCSMITPPKDTHKISAYYELELFVRVCRQKLRQPEKVQVEARRTLRLCARSLWYIQPRDDAQHKILGTTKK